MDNVATIPQKRNQFLFVSLFFLVCNKNGNISRFYDLTFNVFEDKTNSRVSFKLHAKFKNVYPMLLTLDYIASIDEFVIPLRN